ncbi:MAG TPA: glycosyltransferase [Kineosporiaceae bacterium]
MTSFVSGPHTYVVPVLPGAGPDGRGRAGTYAWPDTVVEVPPERLARTDVDAVLLQRPHELDLVREWTGRRPGRDLPALYVEHNTPRGDVADWRHPLADQDEIPIVHVTAFNAAMWDSGRAPVTVIEHGIPDPGYRWTGERETLGVVVNEPVRRWRVAGMDLATRIAASGAPIEVYGIGVGALADRITTGAGGLAGLHEDLPQARLHAELARHRAYLHPYRWTSLGLALIEAMTLGMPVLALAATAAPQAVPADAGVVSPDPDQLARAAHRLLAEPDLARAQGLAARRHALARYGLPRFVADFEVALKEVTA